MRKKIVAGNWKMNTTPAEGLALANEVKNGSNAVPEDVLLIVAPPFTHISSIAQSLKESRVKVAAQNCAAWEKGAYTGEVSAQMIAQTDASHVIIGHSERRQYFGEDSRTLLSKVNLALDNGLTPIYCCGEQLDERNSNQHFKVVEEQISQVLFNLNPGDMGKIIIAYEPVWAIGTGLTASPQQAQEMHAWIREVLQKKFGHSAAQNISLLYGGSCNPKNAKELFAQPDVDGGLIGGAALKADDFITIAQSFPK